MRFAVVSSSANHPRVLRHLHAFHRDRGRDPSRPGMRAADAYLDTRSSLGGDSFRPHVRGIPVRNNDA